MYYCCITDNILTIAKTITFCLENGLKITEIEIREQNSHAICFFKFEGMENQIRKYFIKFNYYYQSNNKEMLSSLKKI